MESIEALGAYFRSEIRTIRKLTIADGTTGQVPLYQKTLLATLLDCLAGLRFHKKAYPQLADKNRERFIRFVGEYGSWSDGTLISTPFLLSRLQTKSLHGDLLTYVQGKMTAFDTYAGGAVPLAQIDVSPDELRPLVVTEQEERELNDVQHLALLYRYRNYLVHEFREPGEGMEVFAEDGDQPCYHGYANDPRFYLVYPISLFESLAESAVTHLMTYFRSREIDPHERVGDTARW